MAALQLGKITIRLLHLILAFAAAAASVYGQSPTDTQFSVDRGFFSGPFTLEITSDSPAATIRFTLDGTAPSRTHGAVYAGPLSITGTTMVRAMAYDAVAETNVDTQTYLFLGQVVQQGGVPAGYPSLWNGFTADYDMDPEIAQSSTYAGRMQGALLAIPTLSVVMDPDDLFGATNGIYQNTDQEGVLWERAASMEWIDPDGNIDHQADCGIRIQGGASRIPDRSPKHSFRLLFKSDYGDTKLRFPLYGPDAADTFDTVVLSAGYNNTWIHQNFNTVDNQRQKAQYIQDQWVKDSQLAVGQPSSHGTFVHLYLNGLYWGLYNVSERPSAPFAADYFGGQKEEYDALNAGEAIDGDTLAWHTLLSLAEGGVETPAKYEAIQQYVDVDNLIDYMTVNFLAGTHDWDHHNWYAARKREPGAGYKFFVWDAQHSVEDVAQNSVEIVNPGNPTGILAALRQNAEFRVRFGDRVHKHFFNGGALETNANVDRWMARANEVDQAVIGESARWGDYRRDVHQKLTGPFELYTRDIHWVNEKNRLLTTFFPTRNETVLQQLRDADLYPACEAPVFAQHGGPIGNGMNLQVTNPDFTSGDRLYFSQASDPRAPGGGEAAGASFTGNPTTTISLAGTVKLRSRVRCGTEWSALTEATFYGDQDWSSVVINEIMYHAADQQVLDDGDELDFLEIHNSGAEDINMTDASIASGVDFSFPDGLVLAAGEYLILAENEAIFASHYGVPALGQYDGKLGNAGETLQLRDPLGNVVDQVVWTDDSPWPEAADGTGPSLELLDPDLQNALASSWHASTTGGTPGAKNSESGLFVDLKLALSGPFDLNAQERTHALPVIQPYGGSPWTYPGTEAVPAGDFNGDGTPDFFADHPEIVDWVLVGFRTSAAGPAIGRVAAFVREDGSLVSTDAVSPVFVRGLVAGNYYITVHHRNHLAVRSTNAVTVD